MKTSNYLAKLPQEASIRQVQAFRDYGLITLDLPAPRQRLCPHCGSTDCVIKDSGSWQTVRHIPSHHRGHDHPFSQTQALLQDMPHHLLREPLLGSSFPAYDTGLYDSILLDLTEPLSFSAIARQNCVTPSIVQSVFETVRFGLPRKLPETICIDEFKGNSGIWSSGYHKWRLTKYQCSISDGNAHAVIDILQEISGTAINQYFHQLRSASILSTSSNGSTTWWTKSAFDARINSKTTAICKTITKSRTFPGS